MVLGFADKRKHLHAIKFVVPARVHRPADRHGDRMPRSDECFAQLVRHHSAAGRVARRPAQRQEHSVQALAGPRLLGFFGVDGIDDLTFTALSVYAQEAG